MSQCDTCQWLERAVKKSLSQYDEAVRANRDFMNGERDPHTIATALAKDGYRRDYDVAQRLLQQHGERFHPPYSNTGVTFP